jgi:serine/threonine protein kinase
VLGTRVGDVLASKYRLEELLGSGGMGHVYRAVNEDVGRAVAIKILRSEHASSAPLVERFLREARAANLVRHPNVVDVLDIGRDKDGSPFIVQELLRGQDLAKYVEQHDGKLTIEEVEQFLLPVIDAVAEAHAQGVVHRDIKPENVFLAEQGKHRVPKLLDFGISKIRLPDIRVTEVGVMMGTPAYMAPEQVQGSRDADSRTDVWALGVMLFELLSGHLPFDATDAPALFVAIATKDVPRLSDVCPEVAPSVARVCERCLRRLPDERYPSALELARDLRHVLEGTEIEPTQRHSLRPRPSSGESSSGRSKGDLVIPDLELPPPPDVKTVAAAKTLPHSPSSLVSSKGASATIAGPPSSEPSEASPLSGGFNDDIPPDRQFVPELDVTHTRNTTSTQAGSAVGHSSRLAPEQVMSGVMMAPNSASAPRRPSPPLVLDRRERQPANTGPDLPFIVGLSVVGLVSIGSTAVLTAFMHQPGGLQLVSMVTKPTSTLNLAVHGGLALLALFLAGRSAIGGVKRWRDYDGGRTSALFAAVFAGAMLFAAIELARAAW